MTLSLVITDAGRAAIANAESTGTNIITIAKVGITASVFTPLSSQTALPGEIKRLTAVAGGAIAPATIHLSAIDASADIYDLHGFGLYLPDDTLFALYSQADIIHSKAAGAQMLLAGDIVFSGLGAVTVTVGDTTFLNPPATTEVQGVVELATNAETQAGTDASRAVTPKSLLFAFTAWVAAQFSDVWRASNDGAGSGLDAGLLAGQLPAYYTAIAARLGYTPANRAGDTFTGGVGRDPQFYMELSGGNPLLVLDSGDYLYYNRALNQLTFTADGVTQWYSIGGVFYVSGGVSIAGNTAWHSGNDGAGSGLDAGLLAGQSPAYYTSITARLGYTPANKAGDTFTGPVIFIDPSFYTSMSGGNPAISWAVNAAQFYDRANNLYLWMIGGTTRFSVSQTGATILGNTVWHAGNDGLGSGLDAGLLGGQAPDYYQQNASNVRSLEVGGNLAGDGSVYLDLHASAGTDFNARIVRDAGVNGILAVVQTGSGPIDLSGGSNVTRSGNTIWHAGNDGAGSGLDAGLLAGQAPSYYTDIVARIGYTPLNQASYTAADVLAKLVTVDGSGSGVDADTVDGLQAAAFALLGLSNSVLPSGNNANGTWFQIGNLIIQVGMKATVGPDTTATVTYPKPLTTNAPFFYIAGTRLSSFDSGADSFGQIIGTPGLTTMTVDNQRVNNSATIDVPWLIISWA